LVGLGNIILGTAADVFAFSLGAQPGIVVLGGLQLEGAELLLDAGQGVGVFFSCRFDNRFGDGFVSQQGILGGFGVGHTRVLQKNCFITLGAFFRFQGARQKFLAVKTHAAPGCCVLR